VCRFLVDGAWERGLLGEVFRPSENSSVARSRLRQAASCAGFLARSHGKPADLAGSGTVDTRVLKFPSDRGWFAPSQERHQAAHGNLRDPLAKKFALIFGIFAAAGFWSCR
jgi:hypothetical protein